MRKIIFITVIFTFFSVIFSQNYDPTTEIRKLIQNGKYYEAEEQLTSLINTSPAPEFYYLLGYSQFRRGSYLESITSLEKALKGKDFLPRREIASTYFLLGECYNTISNYEKSMTYLSDGLKYANGTNLKPYMEQLLKKVEAKNEYKFWTKLEGKYVEFHFLNSKGFINLVKDLIPRFDKIAENFIKKFNIKMKGKIKVFYYGNRTYFKKFFPKEDMSLIDIKNMSVYGFDEKRFIPQFEHLLLYKLANRNYPSLFITEGFNEYLFNKNHSEADKTASFFSHTHKIPSYVAVNDLFFFKNYPESFDLAHSFIYFVIKNVGFNSFLNFWKNGNGKIKRDFKKFFGIKNFNGFYNSWIKYVNLKKYGVNQRLRPIYEEFIENGEFDIALKELNKLKSTSPFKKVLTAFCLIADGKNKEAESTIKNVNCTKPKGLILLGNIYDILGKREIAKKYYGEIVKRKNVPIKIYHSAKYYLKVPFKKNYLGYLKKGGKNSSAYFIIRYKMRLGMDATKILKRVVESSNRIRVERLFLSFPQPVSLKYLYLKRFDIPGIKNFKNGTEFFKNWPKVSKKIKTELLKKYIISASKALPSERIISFLFENRVSFDEMVKYLKG